MHRELEQWVDDQSQPQSDLSLNTATDDTVSPADEDWVHIKPVPPSISNLQQVIPEWVPTQPDEPQMTTNEQGPPQQPAEQDGTPSAPQSDGGQLPGDPQSDGNQLLGTDEGEASREMEGESGGDQETTEGSEQGEEGVTPAAAASSEHREEGVSSVATARTLSWDSLGGAKKRFNYDILPKVLIWLNFRNMISMCCNVVIIILPLHTGDVLSWITH